MPTTWTNVVKASGNSYTKVAKPVFSSIASQSSGSPIGLLLALTYASGVVTTTDPWTHVVKASGNVWTDIAKAT